MNKKYIVLAAFALSTTVSCQRPGGARKRAENYKLLQYRSVLEVADNTTRLEKQRLAYLMPSTFHYMYGKENWLNSGVSLGDSLKRHLGAEEEVIIPGQFSELKIITAQEQQRAIEEEANEKLYRIQSDPSYYENAKRSFQAEYKRRISAKGLK